MLPSTLLQDLTCDRTTQYFHIGERLLVETTFLQNVLDSEELHCQLSSTLTVISSNHFILLKPKTSEHFTHLSPLSHAFQMNERRKWSNFIKYKHTHYKNGIVSRSDYIDIASLIVLLLLLLSGDVETNPGPSELLLPVKLYLVAFDNYCSGTIDNTNYIK